MFSTIIPLPSLYKKSYRFRFLRKGNHENKTLSFFVDIQQKGITPNPVIELTRSELQLGGEKPDNTLLGELIYKSSETLFPLNLVLTQTGYLSTISNFEEIHLRWKEKLLPEYDDGISLGLLEKIGKSYENPGKLLSGLKNDWFYCVFFLPIYQNYKENRCSLKYDFPIFPYSKKTYALELEILEEENKGKTQILISGISNDDKKETLSGTYVLNPDKSIHSVNLKFPFPLKEEEIWIEIQESEKEKPDYQEAGFLYDAEKEREKWKNSPGFFVKEREIK